MPMVDAERLEALRLRVSHLEREVWQIKLGLRGLPPSEPITPFPPIPFPLTPRSNDLPHSQYSCSFCGKAQDEVASLIAGPGRIFICNECVELCHEIEQKRLAKLNKDIPQ